MKKTLLALFSVVLGFNANAQDYTIFQENDIIAGKITAPVTFIEYASMTCGHCANFDKNVVQKLKKEFVETGKVAYTLREFPLDDLAMAVSKVQRCAPKDSYYDFVSAYFRSQRQWIAAEDKLTAISNIARLGGITPEKVQQCILDKNLHKEITAMKNSGIELGINSTPSFLINGTLYRGAMKYDQIKAIIEAELGE